MTKLIPVVEFEPSSFSHENRSSPSVAGDKDPEAWQRYWKNSLADSGITELDPVGYSWLAHVADITRPETIATILRVYFQDRKIETLNDLEFISSIDGGYILKAETHTIYPTCCVSLEDIEGWEIASDWREPKWKMIWIGHPWIYCRYNGSQLEFTLPTESSEELVAAFAVIPVDLEKAVEAAREMVTAFGDRLRPELEKLVPQKLVEPTLKVLLWGKYPF
jgi:hypothetical protein